MVDDQHGRLTFTSELVRALQHLLAVRAPYGTYNVSNGGPVQSWFDIARAVYAARGTSPELVTPTSTAAYGAGKALAPRPRHSAFDLAKLRATGFEPRPAAELLADHLRESSAG